MSRQYRSVIVGRSSRKSTPYGNPKPNNSSSGNRRVYVGNLSWEVEWQDLKDHFKPMGTVVHADVLKEPSGRSKGCGIVEFSSAQEASRAITRMTDTELKGRSIFVREDREDKPVGGGSGRDKGQSISVSTGGGRNTEGSRRVYVGNLSWEVEWQNLKDHFKQAGTVIHADVLKEPSGRSKGCGIVEFASAREAQAAIQSLTDTELMGRAIFVREDREDKEVTGGGSKGSGLTPFSREGAPLILDVFTMSPRAPPIGAGGYAKGGGGGGGGGVVNSKVYVHKLDWSITWQQLKDHFKTVGQVVHADVMTEGNGRSKGCGVVEFSSPGQAASAIARLNDSVLGTRPILVREYREA